MSFWQEESKKISQGKFLPISGIKIREIWLQNLIHHPHDTLKFYFFLLANLPKNYKKIKNNYLK